MSIRSFTSKVAGGMKGWKGQIPISRILHLRSRLGSPPRQLPQGDVKWCGSYGYKWEIFCVGADWVQMLFGIVLKSWFFALRHRIHGRRKRRRESLAINIHLENLHLHLLRRILLPNRRERTIDRLVSGVNLPLGRKARKITLRNEGILHHLIRFEWRFSS